MYFITNPKQHLVKPKTEQNLSRILSSGLEWRKETHF